MTDFQALQIQPAAGAGGLTPHQQQFNTLVQEVAHWRAALADWQQRISRCEQVLAPLHHQLEAAFQQWLAALDTASLLPGLTRGERAQLAALREEAAAEGRGEEEEDGPEAGATAPSSAAPDDRAAEGSAAPAPDDDPLAAFERIEQQWQHQAEAAAARRTERAARRRADARRQREAQQTQAVSQSLRDVYRKLASALHPDREPDPQERERKTRLMQQANQAYAAGHLLALLELQLQAEQLDAARLGALDAQRLRHYVTVLQEQLAELQTETRRLEAAFRAMVGAAPGTGLQPRKADRLVSAEAQRLRDHGVQLGRQTRLLGEVEAVQEWLRQLRRG